MNGVSDDFYRRLYGSIEAPPDWSELLPRIGPRDYFSTWSMNAADREEYRAEGNRIADAARRAKIVAAVLRRRAAAEQTSGGLHCAPQSAMEGST